MLRLTGIGLGKRLKYRKLRKRITPERDRVRKENEVKKRIEAYGCSIDCTTITSVTVRVRKKIDFCKKTEMRTEFTSPCSLRNGKG